MPTADAQPAESTEQSKPEIVAVPATLAGADDDETHICRGLD
jgi:hypothetical protein